MAEGRGERQMITGDTLWIVGQYRGQTADGHSAWDFQGVFTTQVEAEAACRTDRYFVGPAILGESLPHERMSEWPGAYYPKVETDMADATDATGTNEANED